MYHEREKQMQINIKVLRDFGFNIEVTEKAVTIYSDQDNPRARKHLHAASDSMGFGCEDADKLLDAANHIATMRAIKLASD